MEILKKMSVFLMLLIALILSIGGLWHQLQGGSMFYTLIGLLYGLSLNFYLKKQEKKPYMRILLYCSVLLSGHLISMASIFYSVNYFCLTKTIWILLRFSN